MNTVKINQHDLLSVLTDKSKWESLGLDPKKGYVLLGNPGIGKTYAMREEAKTQKIGWGHPNLPSIYSGFRDLSSKFIFSKCEMQGSSYLNQFCEDHEMWLDDLGFEPTECNSYGTKFIPMQDLIFHRHKLFPYRKTSFTTNYTPDQLEKKYGPAILSRLKEMCNFIIVTGEDRRS
jgi:DNA replication protein DnaC